MSLKGKTEDEVKYKKKERCKMSKLDKLFGIPDEIASDVPKVTIVGFDKMLIENYKCILEYQDFFIRIKMATGLININGFNLLMNEMTKDDLIITGIIESVDFEKNELGR